MSQEVDPWLEQFCLRELLEAKRYAIDDPKHTVKLDQNEFPIDWTSELKGAVCDRLQAESWNRYPPAFDPELHRKVATYLGVDSGQVLLGSGSDSLLAIALEVFSRKGLVIARPSFPLYENRARATGSLFHVWPLDRDFEYDLATLPKLQEGTVVCFASPNNPTGTLLKKEIIDDLCRTYPSCLFVADEAYWEFVGSSSLDLLSQHRNLILVRTFSKTLASAGVRLGYVLGDSSVVDQMAKLQLPYALNHFTRAATEVLLQDSTLQQRVANQVDAVKAERERVYKHLSPYNSDIFRIIPSAANFHLIQWCTSERVKNCYRKLVEKGILIRDISRGPQLEGCLRASVGTKAENQAFIDVMQEILEAEKVSPKH